MSPENRKNVQSGCDIRCIAVLKRTVGFAQALKLRKTGSLDCEQRPIHEQSRDNIANPDTVRGIINEGCEAAPEVACMTLEDVREAMGLIYRN